MLTLKQLDKELKVRGLKIDKSEGGPYGDEDGWELTLDGIPDALEKKFKQYKKKYLDDFHRDEEERKNSIVKNRKLYPADYYWKNVVFHPETPMSDETLRDEFLWERGEDEDHIFMSECDSVLSCAISEFGNFDTSPKLDKHWDLLLTHYIRNSDHHYHKCAVPDQKQYAALNKALAKVGFEKRAAEKSNHGKYKVFVWEYIKK